MGTRNYLKTTVLLAAMSGLLLFIAQLLGGTRALPIALALAVLMNGAAYFFSDKIAVAAARAKPISEAESPDLYRIVRKLANRAQIPMPRLYLSPSRQPNAFATGRNPQHAVVAATIGAIITFLARLAIFIPIGGGGDRNRNPFSQLALLILAPIAALMIQLAVTRSREFGADASGATLTADPRSLASALRKIEVYSRGTAPATTSPSTAHLFISNPFKSGGGGGMAKLFSTHPPTAERVARLEAMAYDPRSRG